MSDATTSAERATEQVRQAQAAGAVGTASRPRAPIRDHYETTGYNSARKVMVEGNGFVERAFNLHGTLARTTW